MKQIDTVGIRQSLLHSAEKNVFIIPQNYLINHIFFTSVYTYRAKFRRTTKEHRAMYRHMLQIKQEDKKGMNKWMTISVNLQKTSKNFMDRRPPLMNRRYHNVVNIYFQNFGGSLRVFVYKKSSITPRSSTFSLNNLVLIP